MGSPLIHAGSAIRVQEAAPDDAPLLARLADLAGEGLPRHLWAEMAGPGQDPFAVGADRARRDDGAFSWRNARVATWHGASVGAVIDYDLDDPSVAHAAPAAVAPLLELEAFASGTRYLNVLAILPQARRRGAATALLADVSDRTRRDLSLIVASGNRLARGLYVAAGFEDVARLAMGPGGPEGLTGDWILMSRPGRPSIDASGTATGTRSVVAA